MTIRHPRATDYVLGFLLKDVQSRDAQVLLIAKGRPSWQAGLMNGLGGKREARESPELAMTRELYEEAGIQSDPAEWYRVATLHNGPGRIFIMTASGAFATPKQTTDEYVAWHHVRMLPANVIPNLRWLIPMCVNALTGADDGKFTIIDQHAENS